ncbi:expressed unknown protein [Seminavis robusta]|uniref:Mediator of RNA polymerase II transcription subunit 10 n=1 Tax=Seminavis robusta TaxID=568900 RepID=A0A9N8E3D1_9STRA|nr:expressed unknown protein [Seminavis robusta]|eukprot:Sro577_g169600.1 n/a (195) ;mRNA; f:2070-2654
MSSSVNAGAKALQERLHELITRLAATTELVKNWPESKDDDASIHVETTTKLISHINNVIASVQRVDGVVKADALLRKNLQECLIPLDLLDLLDHGNGLNPDCFSRALLREALGQLAGLKRRKLALEMLGAAVQSGLNREVAKERKKQQKENTSTSTEPTKKKRKLELSGKTSSSAADSPGQDAKEPPTKKQSVS